MKASVSGNHLVIADQTGGAGSLSVQDVNDNGAATSLGIAGNVAGPSIAGTEINYLSAVTSLSKINDGNGLRLSSGTTGDLTLNPSDGGAAITVSLSGAKTIGDVIKAINTAGGTRVTATLNGAGLKLASSGGTVTVTDANGSKAAEDLGLANTTGTGSAILAGLGTSLLSRLNGGSGIPLGVISIQSRGGSSATNVDLTGSTTIRDVLDKINNASAGVKATLNSAGNGIEITDSANGSGNLVIGDVSGTTAAALGIAGTTSAASVQGANLHHQYINGNTLLTNYNGGAGVAEGQFRITDSRRCCDHQRLQIHNHRSTTAQRNQ